jgi:hypothetical protein
MYKRIYLQMNLSKEEKAGLAVCGWFPSDVLRALLHYSNGRDRCDLTWRTRNVGAAIGQRNRKPALVYANRRRIRIARGRRLVARTI